MEPLHDLTIKKFHDGLLNKEFSALEVTQAYFRRIKEHDGEIGAYLSLAEESATHDAGAVDVAVAEGEDVGMLAGVPLGIKDNILIKGLPATAASKILENYVASYDAGVITKLKSERVVFLGKTNLDEFAMGASTENSAFKITHNPHDTHARSRRHVRRFRRGARGALCRRGARLRHRRLDPPAGELLRHRRHESNLWRRFPFRRNRDDLQPRSSRPDD